MATTQKKALQRRVPLGELFIDPTYQRPYKPKWAKEIAENYRPHLFHPITVSDRNGGGKAVFDGQHRFRAAELMDEADILAEVWTGLSVQEEADLFAMGQRGRKALTPLELWKARVVSGVERDPLAVTIDSIVREKGFNVGSIATTPYDLETRSNINSVNAVEYLYKRGVLGDTLDLVNLVWRRADGVVEFKATSADMLRGLGVCIDGYENRMTSQRLELLKLVSPSEIIRGAQGRLKVRANPEMHADAVLSELRSVMHLRGKPKQVDRPRG